jgi:hypothetical protein
MPIAANTPTERAEQLLILTERLTGLIEKEVDLFNERRQGETLSFTEERATLATIYAQEMNLIRKDKSLLEGITRELKEKLKVATIKFQAALSAHNFVLDRMRTISEKIVKAVSDEVTRSRAPTLGYGKSARLNVTSVGAAMPLALNETA